MGAAVAELPASAFHVGFTTLRTYDDLFTASGSEPAVHRTSGSQNQRFTEQAVHRTSGSQNKRFTVPVVSNQRFTEQAVHNQRYAEPAAHRTSGSQYPSFTVRA